MTFCDYLTQCSILICPILRKTNPFSDIIIVVDHINTTQQTCEFKMMNLLLAFLSNI